MKAIIAVMTATCLLVLATSVEAARKPKPQTSYEQFVEEIVENADTDSPGQTCRRIQLATQELVTDGEFAHHNNPFRLVLRSLRRDLRDQLPRKEISRGCFGCIISEFSKNSSIAAQDSCGPSPGEPTTTVPVTTSTTASTSTTHAVTTTTITAPTTTLAGPTTTVGGSTLPPTTTTSVPAGTTTTVVAPTTTVIAPTTTVPAPTTTVAGPTTTVATPTTTVVGPTTTVSGPTTTVAGPTTTVPGVTTTTTPAPTTTVPGATTTTIAEPTTTVPGATTTTTASTTTVPGATTTTVPGATTTTVGATTTTTLSNACGNTFPACGGECPAGTSCTNAGSVCQCRGATACAPATIFRRMKSRLGDFPNSVRQTQLSTGWSGTAHEIDIPGDLGSTDVVDVACDANCENCNIDLNPIEDDPQAYCRCQNNPQQVCNTINGPDEDDCGTVNNTCQCNYGSPLGISAGGTPVCVVNRIKNDYGGTMNLRTGEWFDTINLVSLVHLGLGNTRPCPTCENDVTPNDGVREGTCNGGISSGSCDVNAAHPTFGPMSLDCPPAPQTNISGNGLQINLQFGSGTKSLAATLPCSSPLQTLKCPCKVCSNDGTLGCSSDADCQGGGTCTASGGAGAKPNACDSLMCDSEGRCIGGPEDRFCDGTTHPDGRGFVTCLDDAECQTTGEGNCSITENRRCYTDPIVRQGNADPIEPVSVAIFCIPPTNSTAVNASGGLPGPGTFDLQFGADIRCRNDITKQYELPDGANCLTSSTTTTTTIPLVPCGDSTPPLCAGTCPQGEGCLESGGACACTPTTTTTLPPCGGQFPLCSGNCSSGQLCLPDVLTQTCLCTVVQ